MNRNRFRLLTGLATSGHLDNQYWIVDCFTDGMAKSELRADGFLAMGAVSNREPPVLRSLGF